MQSEYRSNPKISVIIPVYNAELYLEHCLESIMAQTLQDFELICVDDGSTDNSLEILKKYQADNSRMKILTQKNQFAGVARNRGMDIAIGEYLLFLDADDFFAPNMLELLYQNAVEYHSDLVLCDGYYFNNLTKEYEATNVLLQKHNIPHQMPFSYKDNPDMILHMTIDCPWNKLFKRDFIERHKLRFQSLRSANDMYFVNMAIILADNISIVNEKLINYRIHVHTSLQACRSIEPLNFYEALLAIRERAQRESRYNDIYKSLYALFLIACQYHLDNAKNYEEFKLLYNFYKNTAFDEWHVSSWDDDEYVFDYNRIWVTNIVQSECASYLSLYPDARKWPIHSSVVLQNMPLSIYRNLGKQPNVIVAMAINKESIYNVHYTIDSLLQQTITPYKILLCLAKEEFPLLEQQLPASVQQYIANGIDILWCDQNFHFYNDCYYAMQTYSDDIIVTVDGTMCYPNDMIDTLVKSYLIFPYAVSAMQTLYIMHDERGNLTACDAWKNAYANIEGVPSIRRIAVTKAGVLYPPHSINLNLINTDIINTLSYKQKDIWHKIMQIENNTPVVLAADNTLLANDELIDMELSDVLTHCGSLKKKVLAEAVPVQLISDKEQLQKELDFYKNELELVHDSMTFKVGRILTWVPRLFRQWYSQIKQQ